MLHKQTTQNSNLLQTLMVVRLTDCKSQSKNYSCTKIIVYHKAYKLTFLKIYLLIEMLQQQQQKQK